MTKNEVMQMALTVLERTYKMDSNDPQFQAVKALCTALAQPEKECSRVECGGNNGCIDICWKKKPQRKEWVGLTDDEYEVMAEQYITNCYFDTLEYAKAIQSKLKEKNT